MYQIIKTKIIMATRIYQGRITSAEFGNLEKNYNKDEAFQALDDTFCLFHDAINYHLMALAGMASFGAVDIITKFYNQVKGLFDDNDTHEEEYSFRKSVCRTLNIPLESSFESAIEELFKDVDRKDAFKYILEIFTKIEKGKNNVREASKKYFPLLCTKDTKTTFELGKDWIQACKKNKELHSILNDPNLNLSNLSHFASEMQLTYAGVKCDDSCWDSHKLREELSKALSTIKKLAIPEDINKKYFEDTVSVWEEKISHIDLSHIRKNKGGNINMKLRNCALIFIAFHDELAARLLKNYLKSIEIILPDYPLEDDPFILARGEKGFVYRGYTSLPLIWNLDSGKESIAKAFDILAFREAFTILHQFILKTEERNSKAKNIVGQINYLETGKDGKKFFENTEDLPAVLGGDPRFDALKKLVTELSPDAEGGYQLSKNTIRGFDDLRKSWLKLKNNKKGDFEHLISKVRELQRKKNEFGSHDFFAALCKEEYHCIWDDNEKYQDKKFQRSENIIEDFSSWQKLQKDKEKYKEKVQITAANPKNSPRQLLYSDQTIKLEFVQGDQQEKIKIPVIVTNKDNKYNFKDATISFSAPRFERDEMGRDSTMWKKGLSWLQPMMKALNLDDSSARLDKTPTASLYIKYLPDDKLNRLQRYLNFSVELNLDEIQQKIGKLSTWNEQFNGQIEEKLHLHWQGTCKKWKVNPWWKDENISTNGFNVLGIDLGVRFAAAWSLINVQKYEENQNLPPQCRYIGTTEGEQWYGNIQKQGKIKIDGERSREVHGKIVDAVAYPSEYDLKLANKIFSQRGITKDYKNTPVLKLGNDAIACFKKMLSRTRTLQSYLSKLNKDNSEEYIAKHIKDIHEHFSYSEYIKGIIVACENQDLDKLKELLSSEILRLIKDLSKVAIDLTTLILPRKHGHWDWKEELKEGWQGSGEMVICEGGDTPRRNVYHRGGLSIARIEQLEKLRQSLQSMSKILSHEPGEEVPFGRQLRDLKTIDPCPSILEKIENMREQRVNVIAHEIVAQALGVRLRPSRPGKNANKRDVIHGEYEIIPGRKPVDLVVMENLSRYTTNNDRSKTENSTLMRWCHRQITAKIVQILEDVFGIPVLFTHAAYTSKFDSIYSTPGFRPEVMTEQALCYMKDHEKNETLKKKFEVYLSLVSELNNSKYKGKIYLLKPHYNNGGEMFLTEHNGEFILRDADLNASANIAWRGIAAPEALHLLHRVRLENKKDKISPVYNNNREKALKESWGLKINTSPKSKNLNISAFVKTDDSKNLAFAEYTNGEQSYLLSEGITLWKDLKDRHWDLCDQYNLKMLQKAGINTKELEKIISKKYDLPDDKLPM